MIDHINFVVDDVEKTAELMAKLGYKIHRRTEHHEGSIEMEHPEQLGLILEFGTKRPQDTVGFNHACFKLKDMDQYKELDQAGVPFVKEPYLSPASGRHVTNFVDNDKIKWQITL